jgi:hypothetical protein
MSEQEKFLARWSRRKLDTPEDAAPADEKAAPQTDKDEAKDARGITSPATAAPEPAFDLESLPSLESIGPNSDIRAFLQPGVPGALSRAALRRAWSADPAISEFVGLAENSWDFTAVNEMTGFGPLDPGEAAKLLAQFVGTEASGQGEKPAATEPAQISQSGPADAEPAAKAEPERIASAASEAAETSGAASNETMADGEKDDAAMQQAETAELAPRRRGHGGALPE